MLQLLTLTKYIPEVTSSGRVHILTAEEKVLFSLSTLKVLRYSGEIGPIKTKTGYIVDKWSLIDQIKALFG